MYNMSESSIRSFIIHVISHYSITVKIDKEQWKGMESNNIQFSIKVPVLFNGERIVFSINGTETLDIYLEKNRPEGGHSGSRL